MGDGVAWESYATLQRLMVDKAAENKAVEAYNIIGFLAAQLRIKDGITDEELVKLISDRTVVSPERAAEILSKCNRLYKG